MSAKRFGGQFSPDAAGRAASALPKRRPSFAGREPMRLDVRARLLYVLPAPLLFAAFWDIATGDLPGTVLALAGFVLLLGGAWMLNEGLTAERAYAARAVARRPAIPRKIFAAVMAGLGVGLAQLDGSGGSDPLVAAGFGLVAFAAHLAAFGIDPLSNKGIDLDGAATGHVADVLDRADATLREIHEDAVRIGDHEITERLSALGDEVRAMLRRLDQDPRDLTRARRYLSVHLVGAREATRKYAESHGEMDDPRLRGDFLALIDELEQSFQRGSEKLSADDRTDLEIEIEVLRERLGREGGSRP
ncbi:MAG: 5-bromo-4-chloroindolyl phosphate hydrolysis family protein [Pseudomonadota bacterium]